MRPLPGFRLFALLGLLALLLLTPWPPGGSTDPARAQGPVIVSLDMNPAGNYCPGDGLSDCTVGTINSSAQETSLRETVCTGSADEDGDGRVNDGCPAVLAPETICTGSGDEDIDGFISDGCPTTFVFDIVIQNLPERPADQGLAAIDFQFQWGAPLGQADVFDIIDRSPISPTIHVLAQAVGSSAYLNDAQALPQVAPPYVGASSDLGADEPNPPWSQGTASRYTATVDPGAAAGTYALDFVPGTVWVSNAGGDDECVDGPGCTVENGFIAVGQPGTSSVGGMAELPEAAQCRAPQSATPPEGYIALGGLAALATLAVCAGAWCVRRRCLTGWSSRR